MIYTSVWLWPAPEFGNGSTHNFIAFVTYWGCFLSCSSKRASCLQSGVYSAMQSAGKSPQKCRLHAVLLWRWSADLIGRLTKISGSQVTQSRALPNILVWSSKAFKIMTSFKNVSSSTEMIWITPVLVWGQHAQPCRIKPLDREAMRWRKGQRWLPALLSQTSALEFRAKEHWTFLFNANLLEVLILCKLRSTKEAKTSNTSFSYLLTATSGTKSNSFWVSGKSKTAECPRRGFLGIYVPSARRVIIKTWIFLLSWETKKNCLNSLNSSCQAVKHIPFMPVSCCLFSLCLFL